MPEPIIDVRGVHKRFGDVHALAGVDLSFQAGSVYGLLGPNGAGKTTLINVLATLLVPDEGTAVVAGNDVLASPDAVRRSIGLAGQFAAVDDYLTGRETVEMVGRLYGWSPAEARRRAAEVLDRFSLSDAADRPARGYSGGMRRRLDLAASLVGEPTILFLDEPTTGIDPGSRLEIWDLIEDLVDAGTTVLLTTQYLEEADALADRIGVISDGRLVREGTAEELKDSLGYNEIRLRVAADDEDAALRALEGVVELERTTANEFTTPATEGNHTLLEIVRRFDEVGVEPLELALERPTLDDVFLSVTGSRPDAGADGDAAPDDGAERAPARPRRRSRR